MAREWMERCAWTRRRPEFGELALVDGACVMEFAPAQGPIKIAAQLWDAWRAVPHHPCILDAVADGKLKYAAIDWSQGGFDLDVRADEVRLATTGRWLMRVFEHLISTVGRSRLAWFLVPRAYFDLEGHVRVAFGTSRAEPEPIAPWVFDTWPHCDDSGVVFAIGHALRRLAPRHVPASRLSSVIEQCIAIGESKRTLSWLDSQLHDAGANPVRWRSLAVPRRRWTLTEQGLGKLELGHLDAACDDLYAARELGPVADELLELAQELRRGCPDPASPPAARAGRPTVPWSEVVIAGGALEHQRNFVAAIYMYLRAHADGADHLARLIALARCHLACNEPTRALSYAERAVAVDDSSYFARHLRCTALLRLNRHDEALSDATLLCAADASDARAHYLRGKALLGLTRYVDARSAFERAIQIDPQLVEAMLLRREVDRAMKNMRSQVGEAVAMEIDLPADVPELRAAMAGGNLDAALELLARPTYAEHAEAQLYRGHMLLFVERASEALAVFDRVIVLDVGERGEARLGRARALAELGRYPEALEEIEVIRAEHPGIVDALSVRAYVLGLLGRKADAEAARAAYVAAATRPVSASPDPSG